MLNSYPSIAILAKNIDNSTAIKFTQSLLNSGFKNISVICEIDDKVQFLNKSLFRYINPYLIFTRIYEKYFCSNLNPSIEKLDIICHRNKLNFFQVINHNSIDAEHFLNDLSADIILVTGT